MRTLAFVLSLFLFPPLLCAQQYDLVLAGGRVIDPGTALDAIRNVGVTGGKIARISAEPLSGKRELNARGLVVAPGFIDLHQHGQDTAVSPSRKGVILYQV